MSAVRLLLALLITTGATVTAPAVTPAAASGTLEVVFLAGGQWDAVLYCGPCGDVGLVDAGAGSDDEILAQLDAWGARDRLKWASVSHYDADHLFSRRAAPLGAVSCDVA
jgi:glyoxylase-like metal-dependent hydrolase (beta-lactamase superfamily II)